MIEMVGLRFDISGLTKNQKILEVRGLVLIKHAFEYAKEKRIDYIFGHTQKDDY